MDEELTRELKKLPKGNETIDNLEDYKFIALSLKIGLRLEDLKELEYKDVAKIMLSLINETTERKATQKDIDKFLGG